MLVLGEGLIIGFIFIPISIILENVVMRSIINIAVGNKIFTDITYIPHNVIISSVAVSFSTILLGTYFPAGESLTSGMAWSISISNILIIWAAVVLICYLVARHETKKLFTSSIVEDIKVLD